MIVDAGGEGDLSVSFEDGKPRFDFNLFGDGEIGDLEEPRIFNRWWYLIIFIAVFLLFGYVFDKEVQKLYKCLFRKR